MSVQILFTKNVDANAQLVKIWLGQATDRNDEGFDRLQQLHRGDDVDGGFLRQDLDSLTEIFSRPWWRRFWVIPTADQPSLQRTQLRGSL